MWQLAEIPLAQGGHVRPCAPRVRPCAPTAVPTLCAHLLAARWVHKAGAVCAHPSPLHLPPPLCAQGSPRVFAGRVSEVSPLQSRGSSLCPRFCRLVRPLVRPPVGSSLCAPLSAPLCAHHGGCPLCAPLHAQGCPNLVRPPVASRRSGTSAPISRPEQYRKKDTSKHRWIGRLIGPSGEGSIDRMEGRERDR